MDLPVAGRNRVPSTGSSAAVYDVAVDIGDPKFLRHGLPRWAPARPTTSNVNFGEGFTGANLVTVPLGSNGAVNFFDGSGSVHFVADLVGYYAAAPTFSSGVATTSTPRFPKQVFELPGQLGVTLDPYEYFSLPLTYGGRLEPAHCRGSSSRSQQQNPSKGGPPRPVTPTEQNQAANGIVDLEPPAGRRPVANLVAAKTTQENFGGARFQTIWIAGLPPPPEARIIVDLVALYAQEVDSDEGLLASGPLSPTTILDTRSPTSEPGPSGPRSSDRRARRR